MTRRLPDYRASSLRPQRPPGTMHDVADAMHVEDHEILAVGIDDAFERLPINSGRFFQTELVQDHSIESVRVSCPVRRSAPSCGCRPRIGFAVCGLGAGRVSPPNLKVRGYVRKAKRIELAAKRRIAVYNDGCPA